eukprot:4362226-Lingulodinium_polyedra.AAC.1
MSNTSSAGQAPRASQASSRPPMAWSTTQERRPKALGAMLSTPRPVPAGNDHAAARSSSATKAAGGPPPSEGVVGVGAPPAAHSAAQRSASSSAHCWSSSGAGVPGGLQR